MGEGSTPLVPRAADLRAARRRALPEAREREPDRELQGPRHDRRGLEGARRRDAGASSCASTGNTAASAAAYAARAGMPAVILQPAGAVALGKLAQTRAVGARVLEVRGSFDEALARRPRARPTRGTHALVNSVNPYRHRGPEDGRVRDRRGARRPAGRARAPLRRRRQHDRLRAGLRRARAARCPGSSPARRPTGRRRSRARSGSPSRCTRNEVEEAIARDTAARS